MLDEGRRRLARGTDVVVAFAETHGRAHTAQCLGGPARSRRAGRSATAARSSRNWISPPCWPAARRWRWSTSSRTPTCPAPDRHEQRWQDVEDAARRRHRRDQHAQHPAPRVAQRRRRADHRRAAARDRARRGGARGRADRAGRHGTRRRCAAAWRTATSIRAERVDAALGNYFRVGNLTALRELALLWLADQVEEGLQRYRAEHGITGTWETKERVVVALTGGPEGETLIRRAARIAARSGGGDLLAVHVARSDGLSGPGVAALAGQRLLVESLGGSYHSVVGDAVAPALLDFARRVDATQIVLGASRRPWLVGALTGPGTGATVTRLSGPIDVHLVIHERGGRRARAARADRRADRQAPRWPGSSWPRCCCRC